MLLSMRPKHAEARDRDMSSLKLLHMSRDAWTDKTTSYMKTYVFHMPKWPYSILPYFKWRKAGMKLELLLYFYYSIITHIFIPKKANI